MKDKKRIRKILRFVGVGVILIGMLSAALIINSNKGKANSENIEKKINTKESEKVKKKVKTKNNTDDCITKVDYLCAVMEAAQIQVLEELENEKEEIEYSFKDLDKYDTKEKNMIETAYRYKFINDKDKFKPEEYINKDYAAYIAAKVVCIYDKEKINSKDVDKVKYPEEACIAVNQEMLTLDEDEMFNPDDLIRKNDLVQITSVIKELCSEIPDDVENVADFKYADNVVLVDDVEYEVKESKKDGKKIYQIEVEKSNVDSIDEGNVLVLDETSKYTQGLYVKVNNAETKNKKIIIEAENVSSIDDVYEEVRLTGVTTEESIEWDKLVGGTLEETKVSKNNEITGDFVAVGRKKGKIEVPVDNTYTIKLDAGNSNELSGNITLKAPKIKYDIHYTRGGSKIKKLELEFINDIEFDITGKLSSEEKTGIKEEIELVRVPIKLPGGFSADVCLGGKMSASGSFKSTISLQKTAGVKYANKNLKWKKDFHASQQSEVAGNIELGLKVSLELEFIEVIDCIEIYLEGGVRGNASHKKYEDIDMHCSDIKMYLYLDAGIGTECVFGKILDKLKGDVKLNVALINDDNSPCKWNWHMETVKNKDGTTEHDTVKECTYKKRIEEAKKSDEDDGEDDDEKEDKEEKKDNASKKENDKDKEDDEDDLKDKGTSNKTIIEDSEVIEYTGDYFYMNDTEGTQWINEEMLNMLTIFTCVIKNYEKNGIYRNNSLNVEEVIKEYFNTLVFIEELNDANFEYDKASNILKIDEVIMKEVLSTLTVDSDTFRFSSKEIKYDKVEKKYMIVLNSNLRNGTKCLLNTYDMDEDGFNWVKVGVFNEEDLSKKEIEMGLGYPVLMEEKQQEEFKIKLEKVGDVNARFKYRIVKVIKVG